MRTRSLEFSFGNGNVSIDVEEVIEEMVYTFDTKDKTDLLDEFLRRSDTYDVASLVETVLYSVNNYYGRDVILEKLFAHNNKEFKRDFPCLYEYLVEEGRG